jgi:hypothetical protein
MIVGGDCWRAIPAFFGNRLKMVDLVTDAREGPAPPHLRRQQCDIQLAGSSFSTFAALTTAMSVVPSSV